MDNNPIVSGFVVILSRWTQMHSLLTLVHRGDISSINSHHKASQEVYPIPIIFEALLIMSLGRIMRIQIWTGEFKFLTGSETFLDVNQEQLQPFSLCIYFHMMVQSHSCPCSSLHV